MQTRLKAKTLELVRAYLRERGGARELSDETGVSYLVIWRITSGRTEKVDADVCQTLYEHLSGNKLVLIENV